MKRSIFLLPVIFLVASARAQQAIEEPRPHLLTLNDCIEMALNESPAIESSRFDVAAATEEARMARAKLLPQLTGSASAEVFSGSPTSKFSVVNVGDNGAIITSTPPPGKNPGNFPPGTVVTNNNTRGNRSVDVGGVELYSAHFSYGLFKDGSILGLNNAPAVAKDQAKRRNLAWTSKLRRDEVVDRITDAFITTASALNRAGYAERRVRLLDLLVGITQEQQRQGLLLPIDLKLAQGQLSGARSLAKILREQGVAGSIELSRALGMDSMDQLHLDTALPEPPDPPSAAQLLGSSLNHHPKLEAQRAVIDEAKEDYRLERYRLYPSVNLDGSALHIDDFGNNNANVYSGTISVSIPIFDFGAQISTTRAKLLKYKAERARLLSVADDVTFEVVKTYQEIYVLSQNILSLQEEVSKADRDLQVISSQQQQGIAPPLTAIEKELRLIAKKDDLDGVEVRRLILYAVLQKAAGGSWQWTAK